MGSLRQGQMAGLIGLVSAEKHRVCGVHVVVAVSTSHT